MAYKEEPFQLRGISLEQTHEMRRDKAIIKLQEQVRKILSELKNLNAEVLAARSLILAPLTSPTHLLIKITKIGVLEDEGI